MAQATPTTDHDEIRRWAEDRGGKPSRVIGTGGRDDAGLLRIDFPGYSGEGTLEEIDWDSFFETFDRNNLAAIMQEETAGGGESRFIKFVERGTAGPGAKRTSSKRAGTARKSAAKRSGGAAKKSSARKTSSRRSPAKRAGAKKSAAKKSSAGKTSARRSPAKKSTARKVAGKKTTARKPAAKKRTASRKSPAKKSSAKKTSPRKSSASGRSARGGAKKASAKKTASKSSSRRSATSRGSSSKTTRDHATIRRWVEERGGWPSHVASTGGRRDAGLLRIDFPGYSGKGSLEKISWDDFFDKFDSKNLSFLYQDRTKDGRQSRFFKFVEGRKR